MAAQGPSARNTFVESALDAQLNQELFQIGFKTVK
jgi:hypothetical protein